MYGITEFFNGDAGEIGVSQALLRVEEKRMRRVGRVVFAADANQKFSVDECISRWRETLTRPSRGRESERWRVKRGVAGAETFCGTEPAMLTV